MKINIKTPEGVHAEQREIEAYIKHIHKKYPNREIDYLNRVWNYNCGLIRKRTLTSEYKIYYLK